MHKMLHGFSNLYLYTLYRIHHYILYSKKKEAYPIEESSHWMAVSFVFYLISIIHIYCSILEKEYSFYLLIVLYLTIFFINRRLIIIFFNKLNDKYQDEKNKKQKGWGVFFYIVSSIIIYIGAIYYFEASMTTPSWLKYINFNIIRSFLNE